MLKNVLFIIITISFLLVACDDKKKETELMMREKQLLEKEKLFAQKESEYQSLLKMRDSIFSKKDSVKIVVWPKEIAGELGLKQYFDFTPVESAEKVRLERARAHARKAPARGGPAQGSSTLFHSSPLGGTP